MTNLNPDPPHDGEQGVGWVTLADGIEMDPAWLARHVPRLYTAWQHVDTTLQRLQLVHLIQQAAATPDQDRDDYRSVHVEWTETTRYEADLYISPYDSDAEIWAGIHALPDQLRRDLIVIDDGGEILNVVDLDGDGHPSVLERAISAGNVVAQATDWTELAASIDPRLTQGPDWPALAAALDRAAAYGYAVAARLPALATQGELTDPNPALELHYRLLADCDAALLVPGVDTISGPADGSSAGARHAPDLGPASTGTNASTSPNWPRRSSPPAAPMRAPAAST
jgi:hypothetical protein